MVRRGVALLVGALVLVLIVVGVNGCLNSRAKNALKDYNRNVAAVAQDSNDQVSKPLFDLLRGGGGAVIDLTQRVNQVRVSAQDDFDRARAFSVPGPMKAAQQHLLAALSLRLEGVGRIADELPRISGNQKRAAVRRIAADMRLFLASDVLFSQRVDPYVLQALDDHDIAGQTVQPSQFLPDDTWLDPDQVGNRLGVAGAGQTGGASSGTCPSTCGHGLVDVKVDSTTLSAAPANNRIAATAATAFTVDFQNQGQVDEFDVVVSMTVTPETGRPFTVNKRVDHTTAGQAASALIRLGRTPPSGPVRLKVTVGKVAGEKTLSNNSQEYVVTFSSS
jgi:hypothetical protein